MVTLFFAAFSDGQTELLPPDCKKILDTKFPGWKLAEIQPVIVEYFKTERVYELPNFIKGDWNGDDKKDFALLIERRNDSRERIILVLMKNGKGYAMYFLAADDCIMSEKRIQKPTILKQVGHFDSKTMQFSPIFGRRPALPMFGTKAGSAN